jgi:hypothetical protein
VVKVTLKTIVIPHQETRMSVLDGKSLGRTLIGSTEILQVYSLAVANHTCTDGALTARHPWYATDVCSGML